MCKDEFSIKFTAIILTCIAYKIKKPNLKKLRHVLDSGRWPSLT